jgi:hypothetical protein
MVISAPLLYRTGSTAGCRRQARDPPGRRVQVRGNESKGRLGIIGFVCSSASFPGRARCPQAQEAEDVVKTKALVLVGILLLVAGCGMLFDPALLVVDFVIANAPIASSAESSFASGGVQFAPNVIDAPIEVPSLANSLETVPLPASSFVAVQPAYRSFPR